MNVGNHHLVVEGRGTEFVLAPAPLGFGLRNEASGEKQPKPPPAEMINVLALWTLDAPEKAGIEETFEPSVNTRVRAARQRGDLLDPEESVIVNKLENYQIAVGERSPSTLTPPDRKKLSPVLNSGRSRACLPSDYASPIRLMANASPRLKPFLENKLRNVNVFSECFSRVPAQEQAVEHSGTVIGVALQEILFATERQ